MSLYTIVNIKEKSVIAISEVSDYAYKYILQNHFSDAYRVSKLIDTKTINKYLLIYDELYLDEIEGLVLTLAERRLIYSDIDECKALVEDCSSVLTTMLSDFSFSKKDYKHIEKTIKILSDNIKPKKMSIFFNVKESIVKLFILKRDNITDLFREHNELRDKYLIKINLK